MCQAEEKSLPQQGLFIILRVTSSVNTVRKYNHSREEKGHELISIKESLIQLGKNIQHRDQLQMIRNR